MSAYNSNDSLLFNSESEIKFYYYTEGTGLISHSQEIIDANELLRGIQFFETPDAAYIDYYKHEHKTKLERVLKYKDQLNNSEKELIELNTNFAHLIEKYPEEFI